MNGGRMKWFFGDQRSIAAATAGLFATWILAAVRSARQHTDLARHLLFDGDDDPFLPVLEGLGVTIVRHRVLGDHAFERHEGGPDYLRIASGAFLRTEIPVIEDDLFVLYTDCDVMFTGEVSLDDYRPPSSRARQNFSRTTMPVSTPKSW